MARSSFPPPLDDQVDATLLDAPLPQAGNEAASDQATDPGGVSLPDEGLTPPPALLAAEAAPSRQAVAVPPKSERQLQVAAPPERAATAPASDARRKPPTPAVGSPSPRPSLGAVWPAPERGRRPLSRKAKLALGGAGALLVLGLIASRAGGTGADEDTPALQVGDTTVVSEQDLKNRREVRPDDFRPKERYLRAAPKAPPPAPAAAQSAAPAAAPLPGAPGDVASDPLAAVPDGLDLEDRRARRGDDPEDLASRRRRSADSSAAAVSPPARPTSDRQAAAAPTSSPYRRSTLLALPAAAQAASPAQAGKGKASGETKLAPAASRIPARLDTALTLDGPTTIVVAVTEATHQIPAGALLLGSASLRGQRVSARFASLVLPDGREVRINGEAQDLDGQMGLVAEIDEPASEDPSIAYSVARDTATDVLLDTLGGGLAGQAATNYVRASGRRSGRVSRGRTVATLSPTELVVFLHAAVVVE